MSVIHILEPHVADMIAAGEVVERPASVIKELMENAFDAGASNVTVEIRSGGAAYIRVSDDGCGMAPEDAGVAFLRHATSKLKDEAGLEAIGTMGFRGEALAAIASVSRIELLTRRRGDEAGTRLILDAGDIQDMHAAGCPEGTSIVVRDLFYNTPARRKFMKSDRSEAAACELAALRCALGRPQVSVRFLRDGKEEFFSPGDGKAASCSYSLLGRELSSTLLPCSSCDGPLKLSGFVSSPAAGRGNRSAQYFFCNGRFIRSTLLQAALEQAYKNTMLTGRFPACVLYLDIGFGSVDVNVHPAKIEVKFAEERRIFDLVYYAVRSALEGEQKPTEATLSPAPRKVAEPRADFYRSMSAESFRKNGYAADAPARRPAETPAPARPAAPKPAPVLTPQREPVSDVLRFCSPAEQLELSLDTPKAAAPRPASAAPAPVFAPKTPVSPEKTASPAPPAVSHVENSVENVEILPDVEAKPLPPYQMLGEALKTYILVEQEDALILIDKHAAHERMIFDRLKEQPRSILSQTLLASQPLRLGADDRDILESNLPLLEELGFEIEPFGQGERILRAVPADLAGGDAVAALEEICEKLRRGHKPDAQSARDEILHTVACKAAIKAGWDTQPEELQRLVEAVLSGKVKYCPHGRPVAVRLSRTELDKQFKRIV